jgi:hypothetical protein
MRPDGRRRALPRIAERDELENACFWWCAAPRKFAMKYEMKIVALLFLSSTQPHRSVGRSSFSVRVAGRRRGGCDENRRGQIPARRTVARETEPRAAPRPAGCSARRMAKKKEAAHDPHDAPPRRHVGVALARTRATPREALAKDTTARRSTLMSPLSIPRRRSCPTRGWCGA